MLTRFGTSFKDITALVDSKIEEIKFQKRTFWKGNSGAVDLLDETIERLTRIRESVRSECCVQDCCPFQDPPEAAVSLGRRKPGGRKSPTTGR